MLRRIIVVIIALMMVMSSFVFAGTDIKQIEAPTKLTVEVKKYDEYPYFELNVEAPVSVKELAEVSEEEGNSLFQDVEYRIGNGEWEQAGSVLFTAGSQIFMNPEDLGIDAEVDIKANKYDFRVRYSYITFEVYDDENAVNTGVVHSQFSNIASVGIDSYKVEYKDASSWAITELDKALEYGFITDKIKDKMNGPITREEFCEIVIKLYEKLTGEVAAYDNTKTFVDTKNPEILKANKLGIIEGVGEGKFAPNNLTNREQVATMMHRAVKVINPEVDFSTEEIGKFLDEELISNWALESVRFMSKNGIMKGDAGKIDPKGTTTREQAVILVLRTYEKYSN